MAGRSLAAALRTKAHAAARLAYGAALRTRYSGHGMPWQVHDQTLRIDPAVRHLVPHDSERPLYEFVRSHVAAGTQVLDVGSFLGVYAVLEARLAGPTGRVVTIEPTAWSASIARRHFHYNAGAGAPITLIEAAAGAAPGRAMLHEYDQPYVNALAQAADVSGPPRLRGVNVVTLDEVCSRAGMEPTFIRMDVQGAEWNVLKGARGIIEAAGKRLVIVAETHPQCWPAFNVDAEMALNTIDSLGLHAAPLEAGSALFARDGHVVLTRRG
jgi:FkbM family methyltransferase